MTTDDSNNFIDISWSNAIINDTYTKLEKINVIVIISIKLISPGYGIDLSYFNLNHIQFQSEMEYKMIIWKRQKSMQG